VECCVECCVEEYKQEVEEFLFVEVERFDHSKLGGPASVHF